MLNTSLITFSDHSKQALKHAINLSVCEYSLDVTHTKASDHNIYKHSCNNIIPVFIHARHLFPSTSISPGLMQ